LPAKGDGGQAAASLTLDPAGTGSGSLLDSFLYTLLKKQPSDVGSSYCLVFFLS